MTIAFILCAVALAAALLFMSGITKPNVDAYAGESPKLDIREYFNGKIVAYGTVSYVTGKVANRFVADIEASWEGDVGKLEEEFIYPDGSKEYRTWTLTMKDDTHFTGTAHDIIGEAQGKQVGNALNVKYTLEREVEGGKKMQFAMDDWMYLLDETHMINRVHMRKFGIKVAELNIAFYKVKE